MKNFLLILTVISLFTFINSIEAKISGPEPVIEGSTLYQSHQHTLEARDSKTNKLLWSAQIPMDRYKSSYDPSLERDVQWNIIENIELIKNMLKVTNSKGEVFFLDKHTGKILKRSSMQASATKSSAEP